VNAKEECNLITFNLLRNYRQSVLLFRISHEESGKHLACWLQLAVVSRGTKNDLDLFRLCFSYIYTSRIFASINQLCLFDDIFFTIIKRIKALEIFWKNTARFIFILRPCPEVAHPRIVPVAIKFRISRAFSLGLFSRLRAHASPWNLPISPSSPSPSLHPPLSSIACRRGGTITVMGVACVIIVILKLKVQLSQFMSREFQGWKLAAAFNASELPR